MLNYQSTYSPVLTKDFDTRPVTININGKPTTLQLMPWVSLLDALREYADLTGTKKGCDHGQCGACTVICDGDRILSCLTLAVMKEGSEITTIEGVAENGQLHPLQKAFIEYDAFQCGYCTPGQICSAIGMLKEGKAKTRADVKELMSGNLCRCGANTNIIDAIMEVKNQDSHE
ncbi:(2Fe-2S)-binding protein [Dyadobacter psychrotolerans]|uniref:2Fe-2S iron-sulfur cluster binding domain-containing protein n=1 Tax=Dyadobacter psychrotolerans TaxID=2541721 RepID=A0A4R5DKJ6_9BACT|nr:2Fe-2S iron-sulfur cluster-binding protein [Dyadobacter psychrotolerans]TDE14702.1 2Fe-2S iron-sulfur cluster binding domain-containing protein [Dyadobacter psychrotolerans]